MNVAQLLKQSNYYTFVLHHIEEWEKTQKSCRQYKVKFRRLRIELNKINSRPLIINLNKSLITKVQKHSVWKLQNDS